MEPNDTAAPPHEHILGLRVDLLTYASATERIIAWAQAGESRCICAANVHMVMEARDSWEFRMAVNSADLVTADGMPLVWTLRARGFPDARRVYGPDLMLAVCARATTLGIPISFFGATGGLLALLEGKLAGKFPGLKITSGIAPPYREISAQENAAYAEAFVAAGPRIIFVGLGCPKQERWMAAMRGRVPAVFIGVGAAFDFHAGRISQAPAGLQRIGLEWAFRLALEPRRLWRRYLFSNPRFLWLALWETRRRKK